MQRAPEKLQAEREIADLRALVESEGWGLVSRIMKADRERTLSLLLEIDARDVVNVAKLQAKHALAESFLMLPTTLAEEREDILARPDPGEEGDDEDEEDEL